MCSPWCIRKERLICAILAPFRNEIRNMFGALLAEHSLTQRLKREDVLRVGDTVQVHEGGTTHHLARVAHLGNLGGPLVIVVPDVTPADPRPPESE